MEHLEESFEKFNYSVRPSKQVERKLLMESLHFLGHKANLSIRDYTYLGFGSIYYTDFILFHRYLYIDKMICVESADIPRRMRFNRPYKFIKLKMGKISEVIPDINFNCKYVIWLDYDYGLDFGPNDNESSILDDIDAISGKLYPGSILIVTAEAEPRLSNFKENSRLSDTKRISQLQSRLQETCGSILHSKIPKNILIRKEMPGFISKTMIAQMTASTAMNHHNVVFHQIANYVYADGAQMVTVGGIIDKAQKASELRLSGIYEQVFAEKGNKPKKISVPPLTIREKESIDSKISKFPNSAQFKLNFELKPELLNNYLKYYKHYPSFHESLM
ncbi:MAG: hypothetical protein PHI34_07830 [Acidobacteriota bacterium]|nr:hypothetical protein [Acidobacteriota bacterium]